MKLDVVTSTLSRILKGQSGISPEMALRLSKALGRSPESWLAMQDNFDLWHAKQTVQLQKVEKTQFGSGLVKSNNSPRNHYFATL